MLSAQLLDKLEYVARAVRNDERPFGGIQLVLCGDFFQLPPVERGAKFCFDAKCWARAIHQCFRLNRVYRQRDERFVGFLNSVRLGVVPPDARRLLGTRACCVASFVLHVG